MKYLLKNCLFKYIFGGVLKWFVLLYFFSIVLEKCIKLKLLLIVDRFIMGIKR